MLRLRRLRGDDGGIRENTGGRGRTRRFPQKIRANKAHSAKGKRLFLIRASKSCRRKPNFHYTPGKPSFSGVLRIFLPREPLRICEPASR